jgi:1-acyl-sn-glycerol-3-phosphate acyltransferase
VTTIRALWRLAGATWEIVLGAAICLLTFRFRDAESRRVQVRNWARRTMRRIGVTLVVKGQPAEGAMLVAANHVSWLDILAVDAVRAVRFVSKADAHHWPVLGYMIECGGTIFIERERRRDAMRVVHHMAEALRAGDQVAVFPEGTTGEGPALLPFHANLLQAAIATGAPVQPVGLRYADARERFSRAATYVGDTSLLQSVWWIAQAERMTIHLHWLPPVPTAGRERRELAHEVRGAIAAAIGAEAPTPKM